MIALRFVCVAVLALAGCKNTDKAAPPQTPGNADSPVAMATSSASAPASAPGSGAAPAGDTLVPCTAAGLALAPKACLSPACAELPADVTACKVDSDCYVVTFATCELDPVGPYYAVNTSSHTAVRTKYGAKYGKACDACPAPKAACVSGTCGFRIPGAGAPPPAPATKAAAACQKASPDAVKDGCISDACKELVPDMLACSTDADCVVSTLAGCEIVDAGPYFASNKKSEAAFRDAFKGKYPECKGACAPKPAPTCIAGACGFKKK